MNLDQYTRADAGLVDFVDRNNEEMHVDHIGS